MWVPSLVWELPHAKGVPPPQKKEAKSGKRNILTYDN